MSDAWSFESTARVDWVIIATSWRVLHAVREIHDVPEGYDDETDADATLGCGRRAHVCIPGMFSRLGKRRCAHCCRATGCPPGDGSPKNDAAGRAWVGAVMTAYEVPDRATALDLNVELCGLTGHDWRIYEYPIHVGSKVLRRSWRCVWCHALACDTPGDEPDPCMEPYHHAGGHISLAGVVWPLGGDRP